ncbi:DENN domain containing pinstripe [Dermatophagoides farinae]|uniref:DENN domain containing pinstripe n=1 Tax=Dermatophagoides farinae TaxID=6954 RepID=UPI003F5FD908
MANSSSPKTSDMGIPASPRRSNRKSERLKMLSQITILDGTMDGKINVSLKIDDCSSVDDSSLALLAMPDGPFMKSDPIKPTFHPFVITVQSGQRIYGGSYIFGLKQIARCHETDEHKVVYISRALVALTIRPLVDQLKKLLEWCVNEGGCNPRWLRCLTNIRLPQKGRFVIIHLPNLKSLKNIDDYSSTFDKTFEIANTVIIFRPLNVYPLFDYSFRLLLTKVITFENLLLLFSCALNEFQILIVSDSYYNLMLISECLIALLNPFKWQHVYVPILPSKLGLHYLDAPTPFIMGINSRLRNFIKPKRIACYFDCDSKNLELNVDSNEFHIPPFVEELRNDLQDLFSGDTRLMYSDQPKSEALKRVSELAHRYNVVDNEFTCLDEVKLNQSIRMLFFNKIKKCILNNYQHYIMCVADPKEQVKFDTVSYLSDQPLSMRPFLQNFVETQMFASFIDEASKATLKKQKCETEAMNMADSFYFSIDDDYDQTDSLDYCQNLIDARYQNAQIVNLVELEELNSQNNCLSGASTPFSPFKKRMQTSSANNLRNVVKNSVIASPSKQIPVALTGPTNWKVVETLLKEVKNKTKRILLAKMGSDEIGSAVTSGTSINSPTISTPEDNTLIAALCDLIERIWSHARVQDSNMDSSQTNRCPFWAHITAYFQVSMNENNIKTTSALPLSSHRLNHSSSATLDSIEYHDDHSSANEDQESLVGWISIKKRIDSLSQLSLDQSTFLSSQRKSSSSSTTNYRSIPSTLSYDYKSICDMTDIKTDVGKSRAFIRLALERKLLSKHLRTLLFNQDLLQSLYKRYSFLRCEDEREQFLTHLLTLNAVDLSCFTNTFTTSKLPYTLVICASSFTGSISIIGLSNHTKEQIVIDGNNHEHFTFRHKNFGYIFTMSVAIKANHKVFIEKCFLRNDVTNALFKFECGKWLGKNMEDGSIERMLIGEPVSGTINDHIKRGNHSRSSSIGRNWSRSGETNNTKEDKYSIEDLQSSLGESINQIMKLYFSEKNRHTHAVDIAMPNNKSIKSVNIYQQRIISNSSFTLNKINRCSKNSMNNVNMIGLFFGQRKFLWIITQVFYYGFKNRRSFRRQTFIWDYLLRIQCELKLTNSKDSNHQDFIQLIDDISTKADTYGKDMKFQLFIFISLRDHKLTPSFLKLLLRPQLLQLHYEMESFLRDQTLLTFLTQILNTFNEIELKLDKNVTKNL